LERLQEITEGFCGIRVSTSTIANYIGNFNYTLKRLHVKAVAADTEALWQERRDFSLWFLQKRAEGRCLVFVDETGFRVASRTSYGRSEAGDRAEIHAPGIRDRNISVVAGITSTTVLH